MRVNLISNNRNQTGLAQDVDILQGIWSIVFPDATFRRFNHTVPECDEAEVNVFFELLNPSLFTYAGTNIWIPNPDWCYKTWEPYFSQLSYIWCKTDHAYRLFKPFNENTKYIGWSSISKADSNTIKDYTKAIVLTGKNIFRHPQIIIDAYKIAEDVSLLPDLHVVYDGTRMNVVVPENVASKITLYPNTLKQSEYDSLLGMCGLAICISSGEGFCHAVNEAASSGCNLLLGEIDPLTELGYEAIWVPPHKAIPSDRIDTLYSFKLSDVFKSLDNYAEQSIEQKHTNSISNTERYILKHNAWISMIKQTIGDLDLETFNLDETSIPEDELPGVTIVTPTKDRVAFMELCAGCVDSQCYPPEKLEWLVLDDGKDTCEDKIKHILFARHIIMKTGKTIAEKRNLGASIAKFPIIVHFDDDDIYPPNSILFRVSMLMREKKGAVFCTVLPSYDIKNFISFMNVPPHFLGQSERVSEATLAYTKQFWQEKGFDNATQIAEGNTFIQGREKMCRELSPQEVIVSLVHPRTTSSRRAPKDMESNGCHFGFTEELFKILTHISQHM